MKKLNSFPQKGNVISPTGSFWEIQPFWPLKLDYLIGDVDVKDYKHITIIHNSRKYAWIMYRSPVMPESLYKEQLDSLVEKFGYDKKFVEDNIRKVPQVWTKEEREVRGVVESIKDDELLV